MAAAGAAEPPTDTTSASSAAMKYRRTNFLPMRNFLNVSG
jgi:hypothetical protein